MNESLLNRILRDHKRQTRSLALILCLSMLVSLGTFAGFHKTAVAKVYTRKVLDCPYAREGAEPVAHRHNDDCYEGETLVCRLPELEEHTHSDECYTEHQVLICTLEENPGHQHTNECYDVDGALICTIPEGEGEHEHTVECYTTVRELTCDKPELPLHVHATDCFYTEEISVDDPEKETFPEMPVSDPNADLESASDWERDFDDLNLSGNWATDLILVAATQQGHGESSNNFKAILNDAGDAWIKHGYTRYGVWYGNPYGEWSAMFVSFCLHYAGIPAEYIPNNPTAADMAESFRDAELFAGRDYVPAVGDLIFFDTEKAEGIDHVGIVYYVDEDNGTINTVEGDRTNAVETFGYHLDDDEIAGYGILPQNSDYVFDETEGDETEVLIVTTEDKDENEKLIVTTEDKDENEEFIVTTEVKNENEERENTKEETMPAQSWERTAGGIRVFVEAPEGAFPENTKIAVTPVNGNSLKDTVSGAVDGEVLEVQAVDITFFNTEGREVEPATAIRVTMIPAETENAEEKANVVHIDVGQQTAELIAQAEGTETDNTEIVFDADAFTIYAIVYTVHFEYEVDGETFTSASMPGAEYTSLAEVIRGLGIVSEEEIDTFVSKISTVASTNEDVAVVETVEGVLNIRVLRDGDAQSVITMQDGAQFRVDVVADGETATGNETATVSTVGDLYLPAEAKVEAKVLDDAQSENAIAAVQAVEELADSSIAAETAYQVFDISLENVEADQYDGFQVEVTLPENVVGRDFRLYHIHDGETSEIELNTLSRPADDTGLEVVSGFTFETKDFSEFVLRYTVDFTYEGRTWSFPGKGSYRLVDILTVLGIEGSIDDAALTLVEGEDNAGALYLTQVEREYYIHSDIAFMDTYELRIRIGEKIYIITVTDEQQTTSPWNLANEDNTQFLHVRAESSVTENELERNAAFKLTFTYSLEEDVVRAIDAYDGYPVLEYDLSGLESFYPIEIKDFSNGVISVGTRRLGNYVIQNGKVILTFTDTSFFDGSTSLSGYFNLTVLTDETRVSEDGEYTFEFPGTGDTVPIHYKKIVQDGTKSVNSIQNSDGSYTLHYTANVNVNSDLDSMTFNDILGGLQTLDADSVKIGGNSVTITPTENGFTFDVAAALGTVGVEKGSYQVTYDTVVTEDQLREMTQDKTTETNKVTWTVNGDKEVPGGETEIEIDKPREPIPVVKNISSTANQPGDIVNYTITYGKDTTELSEFHISDIMTDVVIPQGQVTLAYNGQSTAIDFGAQAMDDYYSKNPVTLFDYTFPEGTEGYGPVTATYSVCLIDAETAKANGIYDATDVTNTAQEHRQNTTDTKKTTVTYDKEPTYVVDKTVTPAPENGNWAPGTVITYTLTIGDADTNMAGVNIKDVMTDLQVLQGDIMIQVGNGSQMRLLDYAPNAITWTDDGWYHNWDVELFNFNMPSDAGNGPVVIIYTTKVIDQTTATGAGIFGDQTIRNTGYGGKQSDGTTGIGEFEPLPVTKNVTQNGAEVNGQTVEPGSTVHYTLTYGKAGMNLAGALIEDQMTDIQKLVGDITVTKADGTSSFTMPIGTGQWSEDGNNWIFWNDGKYDVNSRICLFKYRLPPDIGEGPITIEYDAQIISEEEAKESGIGGLHSAFNKFIEPETEVKINFPTNRHDPQVRKEFDHWDVDRNTLYWNIIVERKDDSAYPIEYVEVREFPNESGIVITNPSIGVSWHIVTLAETVENFDLINATVTTDDGTVLTPVVDYTIDKTKGAFIFRDLQERVHINLAFHSPVQISDGFTMHNVVRLDNDERGEADAVYNNPKVEMVKNGTYTENDRIIKWEVQLNPNKKEFTDSDPIMVRFIDQIPEGLTLINYNNPGDSPTLNVRYELYNGNGVLFSVVPEYENNRIEADITARGYYYDPSNVAGLNKNKITVTYYTKLSDDEWARITSSASGSETFENHVTVTAGDGDQFDATGSVTITADEYLKKTDTTPGEMLVVDDNGNPSKNITYKVEINPHAYVLNENQALSLTDYISTNMDLDTSSVKVVDADGNDVTGLEISYNDDSRLLSIRNIPDQTALTLTYTCFARAQGQDTFTNTATLIGGGSHSSTTTKDHYIQTSYAGVKIDGIFMNLLKIDENNIAKKLEGAKFQLYECKLRIGELTNPEVYDQEYWDKLLALVDKRTAGNATQDEMDQIDRDFEIVEYVPVGEPVVTGESGYTQWNGLSEHKLYAWLETEAPENYTGYAPDDYHYFVGYQHLNLNTDEQPIPLLSPEEQLDRKHAAWALDDACQFANGIRVASMANVTTWTATNVQTTYTSISATKTWEGDSDNLFETRPTGGIKLQLVRINADGTRDNVGDPVAINADENGNWPTYIWNRLPTTDRDGNPLKYTVVEERVENYTTTYSDNRQGQTSGTITVTNKMIPKSTEIYVEKRFAEGTEKPGSIKVALYVIKTDKAGNAGEPEWTGLEVLLSDSNNWRHKWERLDTMRVINGQPYYLTYTVVEDVNALAQQGFRYTVSYSDNGEGVLETTEDHPLLITNAKEEGSLSIVKQISGGDASRQTFTFEVEMKKNDGTAYVGDVTVTDSTWTESTVAQTSTDGKITVTVTGAGTAIISKIPVGTTYIVTEPSETLPEGWTQDGVISYDDSEKVIQAGDSDTVTVKNKYDASTSFAPKVKKIFTNGNITENQFTFILTEVDSVTATTPKSGTTPEEKTVSSSDPVSFTEISYQLSDLGDETSKTFRYTITEEIPAAATTANGYIDPSTGIKYDPTVHRLEVTISDAGDGTLAKVIELDGTEVTGAQAEVTFTNEQLTNFEFYKKWINMNQQEIEWDQDIQVTVGRYTVDTTEDASFKLVYNITKDAVAGASGGTAEFSTDTNTDPKLKLTITTEGNTKKYHFKIEGLEKAGADGEYTYFVKETNSQLDGYMEPSYSSTRVPTGGEAAFDGGTIVNKQVGSYELPETGGIGTTLFTALGGLMTVTAGAILTMRRGKRKIAEG